MTKLQKETIKYLAQLSRIAVAEDEEEALMKDLEKIVSYVEQLREVDTSHLEPCSYVTQSLSQTPLRKDQVHETLSAEEFLALAPAQTARMLRVPPVLKQE